MDKDITFEFENDKFFSKVVTYNNIIDDGYLDEVSINIVFHLREPVGFELLGNPYTVSEIGLFTKDDDESLLFAVQFLYHVPGKKKTYTDWIVLPPPQQYVQHIKELISTQEALPDKGWLNGFTISGEIEKIESHYAV